MVLTFTGSLSAAESGRNEVRTMLIGALGCNLAWGVIDAIFYLMNILGYRGHGAVALRRLHRTTDPAEARALIAEALPPVLAAALEPQDFERLRERLATVPDPAARVPLHRDDLRGALGVFLLVFLSTFPVVIPFLVMGDATLALRVSNGIAIVLLFGGGYALARYSGFHPWRTGLAMVAIGLALVGLTIALGG
jgi:VIT1/CCC1 family predicted Fe2+/Mn2+ transporter